MTTIQINHKNNTIEMTKKFYTESCKYGSEEYKVLQEVRRDYPGYKPVVAKTKKSGTSDPFKGLTFEYMEIYIMKHDDEKQSVMAEFKMLRGEDELSMSMDAQSKSYLMIRDWFLEQYPAVREFHEKREQMVDNVRMKKEAEKLARLEAAKNARRAKLMALIA